MPKGRAPLRALCAAAGERGACLLHLHSGPHPSAPGDRVKVWSFPTVEAEVAGVVQALKGMVCSGCVPAWCVQRVIAARPTARGTAESQCKLVEAQKHGVGTTAGCCSHV